MNFQLINGHFNAKEALEIITQMVHVKIKFQESKIQHASNEDDVKMREGRIKQLQKDLYEIRKEIELKPKVIEIHSEISIGK